MSHHKVVPGLICEKDLSKIREAVCVQVEKLYDSCREKDCVENMPVYFKCHDIDHLLRHAINVKARKAEVVDVYADIEEVPFKRGFYTVDVKFFIKVTLDFFVPHGTGSATSKIITRKGIIVYDKKVILFGSEGNVKIFASRFVDDGIDTSIRSKLQQDNLPVSIVEVAEPIALNAKIEEIHKHHHHHHNHDEKCRNLLEEVVSNIAEDDDTSELSGTSERTTTSAPTRRVVVTVGIFSIIKLIRNIQLLIPAFDFCFPHKECIAATDENPCELFESIEFPFDEFYPPQKFDFPGALETEKRFMDGMGSTSGWY